jgi:Domain of unknown function (DUF4157)
MPLQHKTQTKTSERDRPSQANTQSKPFATPAIHPMLHLQRQMGNQAVGRLIQAKLTVGEANDVYEQEADRVAAEVVSQIHAPKIASTGQPASVQRQVLGNEGEELQKKPLIQCKSDVGGMAVSPEIESSIQQARGSGQSLAESIRNPMEQAFGADFSGVQVHTDERSDRLNRAVQAKAFTTGQDIFFRQGEYSPSSRGGQELLAHELTHVVQQSRKLMGWANPCAGVVQRVAHLDATRLNVAGENHHESDKRRKEEKAYAKAMGIEKYWTESEYTYKHIQTPWNLLKIIWSDLEYYGDPMMLRVKQRVASIRDRFLPWTTEISTGSVPADLKDGKRNVPLFEAWYTTQRILKLELGNIIVSFLDMSKVSGEKHAISKVMPFWESILPLHDKLEKDGPGERTDEDVKKEAKVVGQELNLGLTIFKRIILESETLPGAENLTWLRSMAMNTAAKAFPQDEKGLWKVGNEHVLHMLAAASGTAIPYNIITKEEFNKGYLEWAKIPDMARLGICNIL